MERLVDATRIEQYILNNCSDNEEINAIYAEIINAPTVDAEPVVRCKDCSYCEKVKQFGKVYHYCEAFEQYAEGDLIGVSLQVNPDHYCAWGERREDGAERK